MYDKCIFLDEKYNFLNKKLYHGSYKKFNEIEPRGVNMGLRWQKPRWSTYCWDNFILAKYWALFQLARNSKISKTVYNIEDGTFFCIDEDYEELKNYCIGKNIYVYDIDIKFYKVGLGSSPYIKEYTVDEKIKPTKINSIKVTNKLFDSIVIPKPIEWLKNYLKDIEKGKYNTNRGLLYILIMDPNKDGKRSEIKEKIEKGEIEIGDDISGY